MIVRRTRLTDKSQQKLWPDWRHHAFLTDLDGDVIDIDRFHREHAVVELAIKDLKAGAGLEHLPSGRFSANSAWFQIAILAHNMVRWTAHLGGHHTDRLIVARTIRTRLLALPGRLVNRAGRVTLRLPTRWPWAATFTNAPRHATRTASRPDLTRAPAVRPAAEHIERHQSAIARGLAQSRPRAGRTDNPTPNLARPPQPAPHQITVGGSRLRTRASRR